MGANNWLRHYVYLRLYPFGSTYATLMTYIVSSIWHGFHPGYYLFFLTAGGSQVIARQVRRIIRSIFVDKKGWKQLYDVSTWIASMGLLNMFVPCFDLLHVPLILNIWHTADLYFEAKLA